MAAILTTASAGPFVTGYVPGEICLVLSFRTAPTGSGLYEAVQSWFNRTFPRLLDDAPPPGRPSLSCDLYPAGLRHRYRGETSLLRPISSQIPGGPDPFTTLARSRARETSQVQPFRGLTNPTAAAIALHFYTFGSPAQGLRSRHDDVRELARLVNSRLVGRREFGQPADGVALEAACPNWATAISGNDSGCCPGARPEPALAGDHQFVFESRAINELLKRGDERPPVIAVVDTSPSRAEIDAAVARYPGNRLLKAIGADLGGRFVVPDDGTTPPTPPAPPSLSREALNARLDRYVPAWYEQLGVSHSFLDADHGLFVAGIMRDLAPSSPTYLVRAMNDYGVGDLMTLAHVVRQLPDLTKQRDDRRPLIVNMSLGIDFQPGDQGLEFWLPLTFGELVTRGLAGALREDVGQALAGVNRAAADALRLAHLNLALAVSWLAVEQGALVVASAGNDYDPFLSTGPTEPRVEPRFPARYDHSFGVAAVDRKGRPSQFANRGDVKALVNGVAAFGGDAHRSAARMLPRIDKDLTPILGVFSAKTLPLDNLPNNTGWVAWAGSSFSAPIVSALAARLWNTLAPVEQNPTGVMRHVRMDLTSPVPVASARADQLDVPTIVAWQT